MSNESHTPGPWVVTKRDDDEPFEIVADAQPVGVHIVSLVGDAADARLIAAAPDLLMGCRAAVADLMGDGRVSDLDPNTASVVMMLQSVIAKADPVRVELIGHLEAIAKALGSEVQA